MRTVTLHIDGVTPYSYSAPFITEKKSGESADDFEKRTWRNRCHALPDGSLIIPGIVFKKALDSAASFRGERIPGKGMKTWAKRFMPGVFISDPLKVAPAAKKDEVRGEWLYVSADGRKDSGGSKVWRCFPMLDAWGGDLTVHVLDDSITKPVFEAHVETMGMFVGVGRFSPRVGGFLGRFKATVEKW